MTLRPFPDRPSRISDGNIETGRFMVPRRGLPLHRNACVSCCFVATADCTFDASCPSSSAATMFKDVHTCSTYHTTSRGLEVVMRDATCPLLLKLGHVPHRQKTFLCQELFPPRRQTPTPSVNICIYIPSTYLPTYLLPSRYVPTYASVTANAVPRVSLPPWCRYLHMVPISAV